MNRPDSTKVIHRNFGLDARGIHHYIARLHVEHHLQAPVPIDFAVALCRKLSELARFKEIDKQIVKCLRNAPLLFHAKLGLCVGAVMISLKRRVDADQPPPLVGACMEEES